MAVKERYASLQLPISRCCDENSSSYCFYGQPNDAVANPCAVVSAANPTAPKRSEAAGHLPNR